MRSDHFVAFAIVVSLAQMNEAIEFNNHSGGMAIEISHETVDDLLPTKMQATQLVTAKLRPQRSLWQRHFPAKLFRFLHFHTRDILARYDTFGSQDITSNQTPIRSKMFLSIKARPSLQVENPRALREERGPQGLGVNLQTIYAKYRHPLPLREGGWGVRSVRPA
jgi:hypothetical protein